MRMTNRRTRLSGIGFSAQLRVRRGPLRAPVLPLLLTAVALAACGADAEGYSHPDAAADTRRTAPAIADRSTGVGIGLDSALIADAFRRAGELPRFRCLVVARHGEIQAERCFHGADPDRPANIKSVSKSVLSALVGIAIDDGHLDGPDTPAAQFFSRYLGASIDPRVREITVGNLLSMQAGLEPTSGRNYGRWITSPNWVRYAITRPVVDEPGGAMLYSTGSSHLLSAILTQASGRSTLRFARERLGTPIGIELPSWPADPQGIHFGGNEMRMRPRDLVRFGELYRNEGILDGRRVISAAWIQESLVPRTRSRWSGESYGYGWFLAEAAGFPMFYGWGFGGQYLYVIPDLEMTVVVTSDPNPPADRAHRRAIRELLEHVLIPAAVRGA
jgi:CubicO group peptidase (beta-lactamase class C family)